jgi:phosphodiesterase/alkaline phosphatase D-like protein
MIILQYFYLFFTTYFKNNYVFNIRSAIYSSDKLTISWSSKYEYNNNPILKYGLESNNLNNTIFGSSIRYHENSVHHHVTTNSLIDSTTYYFQVGDNLFLSDISTFISNPSLIKTEKKTIAIYGDMGVENSNKTMQRLRNRKIDLFLHIGDISYADDKGSNC